MDENNSDNKQLSDFSIDHILNRAGCSDNSIRIENTFSNPSAFSNELINNLDYHLPWLQCTRYCPPKIPRHGKKEGPMVKRQLGRHPRIPFTSHQLAVLEDKFQQRPYISSDEVIVLAKTLKLTDIRVKIWFQNRRARERREQNLPSSLEESSSPTSSNYCKENPVEDENLTNLQQNSDLIITKFNEFCQYENK